MLAVFVITGYFNYSFIVIPISLNYCPLVGVKYSMAALLSIPIASYCSIKRLAMIYFSYAQQAHKLNGVGISYFFSD